MTDEGREVTGSDGKVRIVEGGDDAPVVVDGVGQGEPGGFQGGWLLRCHGSSGDCPRSVPVAAPLTDPRNI